MKKITVVLIGLLLSLSVFGQTDATDLIDFQINKMPEFSIKIILSENETDIFAVYTDENDATLTMYDEYDYFTFFIINKKVKYISVGNVLTQDIYGFYCNNTKIFAGKIDTYEEYSNVITNTQWLFDEDFADMQEIAQMGQTLFDYYVGDKYKPDIIK